jgi:hypothetical protein
MNNASLKSNSKASVRTTKSASARTAPRASASVSARSASRSSKSTVKDFLKGLMTTEKLMKEKEYKNKGLANIRLVLYPADMKKMNPEKLINAEFNAVAKDLLKTNDKIPTF